jgi:hypothetical protein
MGMFPIAAVGMGVQAVISIVVGLRLLKLARRTGQFPELALSLATLLLPGVGYPLVMVAAGLEWLGLPGVAPVFFVAVSAMMMALSMFYFFTWRVFRQGRTWAGILSGVGTWLLFAPIGGGIAPIVANGIEQGVRDADIWGFLIIASVITAYGWTSAESFLYWRNARRRVRIGLMEASVCNRFLLWGLASGAWFCVASLSAFFVAIEVNLVHHGVFTLCLGVTGLVNSVCMTLCFMPPKGYLDWLARRAAAAQGA